MSAVFVLPVIEAGRGAPVASLLSTAGWAEAGARVFGASWIVSPRGVLDPDTARRLAASGPGAERGGPAPSVATSDGASLRDRVLTAVPTAAKTLGKDIGHALRGRRFAVGDGPWDTEDVDLVWQRHELFHTAGLDLADRLGAPSALFVPATKVWEAGRWGTRRPGWSGLAERFGETPALRRADVVACGTEAVAEQARRLGSPDDRILVTPNGVDVDRLASGDRAAGRRRAGFDPDDDRIVVGWVGSFRPFHDLDRLVDAVRGLDGVRLLLVGDGAERAAIAERCREAGVDATFTGTVAHDELPDLLAAIDVAVIVTGRSETFHYSPLKLGEYLAAGRAVVAPDVTPIRRRVADGSEAVLVPAGDGAALREAIASLRDDHGRRAELGAAAAERARLSFAWDVQVRRIRDRLAGIPDTTYDHPPGDTTIVPPSCD